MAKTISQKEAASEMPYIIGVADSIIWPGLFLLRDEGAIRIMSGANDSRGYPAKPPTYELWDEDDLISEGIMKFNT